MPPEKFKVVNKFYRPYKVHNDEFVSLGYIKARISRCISIFNVFYVGYSYDVTEIRIEQGVNKFGESEKLVKILYPDFIHLKENFKNRHRIIFGKVNKQKVTWNNFYRE